jgi:hypothetical protein
LSDG